MNLPGDIPMVDHKDGAIEEEEKKDTSSFWQDISLFIDILEKLSSQSGDTDLFVTDLLGTWESANNSLNKLKKSQALEKNQIYNIFVPLFSLLAQDRIWFTNKNQFDQLRINLRNCNTYKNNPQTADSLNLLETVLDAARTLDQDPHSNKQKMQDIVSEIATLDPKQEKNDFIIAMLGGFSKALLKTHLSSFEKNILNFNNNIPPHHKEYDKLKLTGETLEQFSKKLNLILSHQAPNYIEAYLILHSLHTILNNPQYTFKSYHHSLKMSLQELLDPFNEIIRIAKTYGDKDIDLIGPLKESEGLQNQHIASKNR